MGSDLKTIAIYRTAGANQKLTSAPVVKKKLPQINNIDCLKNFKKYFNGEVLVMGDNLGKDLEEVKALADIFIEPKQSGNSKTFLEAIDKASKFDADTIIYFVEDDYIHRGDVSRIISEGLERFDYVSLYDHPDKHGVMKTSVVSTESAHWIRTHSTTMTFATKVSRLVYDLDIMKYFAQGNQPNDHLMWLEILKSGRTLGTPIPGFATHGETEYLSPVINWLEYL